MIDIHCHILPRIDDGAKNAREARAMLSIQQISGADRIYLTPHFYPEKKTLDEFLAEREAAWKELSADFDSVSQVEIRMGAENYFCRELLSLDLRKLTLGESNYLLLEFPHHYPAYAVQAMESLLHQGIIPILAHVERYSYFREDPELLRRLVELGVLAQVSVQSLFDRRDKNFSRACLAHNLAQIVATDAHNTLDRKPCMELLHKLPEERKQLHDELTLAIWNNEFPAYFQTSTVRKTLLGYR